MHYGWLVGTFAGTFVTAALQGYINFSFFFQPQIWTKEKVFGNKTRRQMSQRKHQLSHFHISSLAVYESHSNTDPSQLTSRFRASALCRFVLFSLYLSLKALFLSSHLKTSPVKKVLFISINAWPPVLLISESLRKQNAKVSFRSPADLLSDGNSDCCLMMYWAAKHSWSF